MQYPPTSTPFSFPPHQCLPIPRLWPALVLSAHSDRQRGHCDVDANSIHPVAGWLGTYSCRNRDYLTPTYTRRAFSPGSPVAVTNHLRPPPSFAFPRALPSLLFPPLPTLPPLPRLLASCSLYFPPADYLGRRTQIRSTFLRDPLLLSPNHRRPLPSVRFPRALLSLPPSLSPLPPFLLPSSPHLVLRLPFHPVITSDGGRKLALARPRSGFLGVDARHRVSQSIFHLMQPLGTWTKGAGHSAVRKELDLDERQLPSVVWPVCSRRGGLPGAWTPDAARASMLDAVIIRSRLARSFVHPDFAYSSVSLLVPVSFLLGPRALV
ncbi:hypothetical protein DFP72DRAFT_1130298 [Ephemerocybe angulata]|uniref:Uncharacterized protein n=1 Tax=Ephemerocybe angulata TaxID=980116 RepID=A0A8H6IF40_9AGAR|nr:hypothetical protein DFP72DRAFT_1130298 [Tulosesus angulatus]